MPQQMPSQQMMPQQMASGGIVEMADMGRVPYRSVVPNVDMGRFYDMYGPQPLKRPPLDFVGAFGNRNQEEEEEDLYRPQFTDMQSRVGEIISENNPDYVLLNQSMNQAERIPPNVSSPKEEVAFKGPVLGRRDMRYEPGMLDPIEEAVTESPYLKPVFKTAPKVGEFLSKYLLPPYGMEEEIQSQLSPEKDMSSTDKIIKNIEGGETIVDPKSIANNAVIEDSINKQGTKLGGGAASSANPSGKADEDELQDITDTESLLAQINALRSAGRKVEQPNYESFKDAAEIRADKIREESRRDAYSQALIQFGAGVAEGDMARGLRDAGLAVSKERSEGRKLATEEQRIQEAYALKIAEADSEAEKIGFERESDALTLAATVLGEIGKSDRSVQGIITALLRDPQSAMLLLSQAQEDATRIAKSQGRAATQTDIFNAYKKALLGFSQTFTGGGSDPQVSDGRVIDFDAQGMQIQQ
tara:strand:+ start:1 stop:1416 length:1416 start_codon:yes stop_codon:yes gene_type:complete